MFVSENFAFNWLFDHMGHSLMTQHLIRNLLTTYRSVISLWMSYQLLWIETEDAKLCWWKVKWNNEADPDRLQRNRQNDHWQKDKTRLAEGREVERALHNIIHLSAVISLIISRRHSTINLLTDQHKHWALTFYVSVCAF